MRLEKWFTTANSQLDIFLLFALTENFDVN